ncbi:MAG: PD-(D/E)XK nuclease family protein [Bdellovibrio sp.]
MLKILAYENRSLMKEIFAQYNPRQETWLVSDLRTKFELQQRLLAHDGQYVDESVLRASDLWKILLKRLEPRLRLVSDSFARSLLRTLMDEHSEVLGVNSSAVDTLFAYIDQMAAILFHPEGTQRLEEWFTSHPESRDRWREWYLRARFCSLKLLQEHQVITADWITAYLQNFNELEQVWQTSLKVDLGGEISRVEAELLRVLARSAEVTVLRPHPSWRSEFQYLLRPYEDLQSQSVDVQELRSQQKAIKTQEVLRFSGMLAEIKHAVGQVREWLEKGIDPDAIAIIAPDIEMYWPVLQPYLEEEGIPVQKDQSHKIQSLPAVTRWMALLRSKSGRLSSSDLEIALYETEDSRQLRHEEFKALFKSLYGHEDLARHQIVQRIFQNQMEWTGFVTRDEFVAQALYCWSFGNTDVVQLVLRELLQNATATTKMNWLEWLSYLETIVAMKEQVLEKGVSDGVVITKIMTAHSERVKYRLFLGLTDESLRSSNRTLLSGQDYFDLAKDIGFYLDNPEQNDLEFELRMLAEMETVQDVYSFGATDLSGSLCSPSNFWMSLKGEHEALTLPKATRWDELQHASEISERSWTQGRRSEMEEQMEQDLGRKEFSPVHLTEWPGLSASALENFLECPFIFAAQRYFKLKDFPEVDLDVDHRTRGKLAHALFEVLTVEPMRFDWTSGELEALLERIRIEKKLIFADERLWTPLLKKHIQLGLRFLDFEKKWRQEFQKARTVAREQRFQFYLDPETEEILQEERPHCFRISGQIDRIDGNGEGDFIIVDYKSSSAGISAHGSWLKKRELQLLFYMWVLEKGLIAEVQGEVIGLFYYVFRTFERKGFRLEDRAGELYSLPARRDKNATLETKERYLIEFSQILMTTLERIKNGECQARPADFKTCVTCEWRRQCRAPHLN